MKLATFIPNDKKLKEHIAYFYILERSEDEETISYLGFPTTNVYCVLCKHVTVSIHQEDVVYKSDNTNNFKTFLFVDYYKCGVNTYKGKVFEITIAFKPLGINAFMDKSFAIDSSQPITSINNFSDFNPQTETVFSEENNPNLIQELESFLLTKYNGYTHPTLQTIIHYIQDSNNLIISVKELAKKYNISRITLNNYFTNYLDISPTQFIKINRFRNVIRQFTSKTNYDKLVDIAYLTEYFDQSHMVKDFKNFTGFTPKQFFKKLTQLENGKINWVIQ